MSYLMSYLGKKLGGPAKWLDDLEQKALRSPILPALGGLVGGAITMNPAGAMAGATIGGSVNSYYQNNDQKEASDKIRAGEFQEQQGNLLTQGRMGAGSLLARGHGGNNRGLLPSQSAIGLQSPLGSLERSSNLQQKLSNLKHQRSISGGITSGISGISGY